MTGIEIVMRFFNAMTRRDFDAAADLIDEDIVYDNKPLATLKGREKFELFLRPWVDTNDEISVLIHNIVEVGEMIIVERTDRDRHLSGPWVSTQAAGFFRIRDGKIAEWRDYYDLNSFCLQTDRTYGEIVDQAVALAAA